MYGYPRIEPSNIHIRPLLLFAGPLCVFVSTVHVCACRCVSVVLVALQGFELSYCII